MLLAQILDYLKSRFMHDINFQGVKAEPSKYAEDTGESHTGCARYKIPQSAANNHNERNDKNILQRLANAYDEFIFENRSFPIIDMDPYNNSNYEQEKCKQTMANP